MAVDSTSKEYNFQRSVRKLFLDFSTDSGVPVYFNNLVDVPLDNSGDKLSQWLIVVFGKRDHDTVTEQYVRVFLFTRDDYESDEIIKLSDTVYGLFFDSGSGLKKITLYDTDPDTWVEVGGIIPYVQPFSDIYHSKDDTKYRQLNILCKWGAK